MNRKQLLTSYTEKFLAHRRMWESEWNRQNTVDLSSTQATLLTILNKQGPKQSKDLVEDLFITSGGMTTIADKLIAKHLIRRIRDEHKDRRAVYLEITDEGRETLTKVEEVWDAVMAKNFSVLSDAEVAMLQQIFVKLVEAKESSF